MGVSTNLWGSLRFPSPLLSHFPLPPLPLSPSFPPEAGGVLCESWGVLTPPWGGCGKLPGSAPDPAGGAYSAPPEPIAVVKGPTTKGREGKGEERDGRGLEGPPISCWHRASRRVHWSVCLRDTCIFRSAIIAKHWRSVPNSNTNPNPKQVRQ